MSKGVELIAAERQRQISEEGWDAKHDANHDRAELAQAAHDYIHTAIAQVLGDEVKYPRGSPPRSWPWEWFMWNPSDDPIRNLVKAAALLAAEIDRIIAKGDSNG